MRTTTTTRETIVVCLQRWIRHVVLCYTKYEIFPVIYFKCKKILVWCVRILCVFLLGRKGGCSFVVGINLNSIDRHVTCFLALKESLAVCENLWQQRVVRNYE